MAAARRRARRPRSSPCTGGATATTCRAARGTTTSSPTCARELRRAGRGAGRGRHPARRHPARPRSRLRQARRPQLGAAAPPRRDRRPRATGSSSARRARRSSASSGATPDGRAAHRWPRRRHRGHDRCTPHSTASGRCGCTTWPATVDALDVADALAATVSGASGVRPRPHPAVRRPGSRVPRGLRARAPGGAGVRRRRRARRRPRRRRGAATTSPTPSTTARSAPRRWPASRASRTTSSSGSPSRSPRTRCPPGGRRGHRHRAQARRPRWGAVRRRHRLGDPRAASRARRHRRRREPAPRGPARPRRRLHRGRGAGPPPGVALVSGIRAPRHRPGRRARAAGYVNAVVLARTSLSPASLLRELHALEADFDRRPARCGGARAPSTSTSCSTATRSPAPTSPRDAAAPHPAAPPGPRARLRARSRGSTPTPGASCATRAASSASPTSCSARRLRGPPRDPTRPLTEDTSTDAAHRDPCPDPRPRRGRDGLVSFCVFTLLTRERRAGAAPVAAGRRAARRHGRSGAVVGAAGASLPRGPATTSLDPLRAARTVVLAQAAALTGSAAAGWYAGQLVVVSTDLSLVANRSRILPLAPSWSRPRPGGRRAGGPAMVPGRPARRGRRPP